MENNPKKSKAFIIAFILILLLLIVGYYLFTNRAKIFDTKGVTTFSKVFAPLLGTSKDKGVKVIDTTGTDITSGPITGIVITDQSGNKIVRAEAGEPLKKGDVLYISGFNKNKDPIVMKAIANDKKKSLVFGVAGEDMLKGAMGNVIIEGILSGVPTNKTEITIWAPTNPLYLSDKTYGGMTKNPPFAPSFVVQVGSVISIDPINGSIRIGGIITAVNPEILNTSSRDTRDYLGSIFGNNNGNGNDNGGNDNNGFTLNSITIPGTLGSFNNFPTVTVVASPASVKIGETSTISWISTKATVCNAGVGRGTGTTGSFKTGALSRSMSYSVTCTGANGSKSSGNAFVTILDSGFSNSFPSVKVTAKPMSIKSGLTSTISWVASKSVSCDAGPGNSKGTTGSFKTSALTKSMSYTITCKNATGDETSGDAFVNVIDYNGGNNNFPTVQIKANPVSLKTDASSIISWTSTNTTSCDAGTGNGTGVSGSFDTGPMKESKSYSIICKGDNGEASNNTFVNVTDNYKFPTVTLTAVPPSVDKGKKSTISWTSTDTTSCNAGVGHGTGVSGSFETEALTVTKSYSVTCIGPNGSRGANISVSVNGETNIQPNEPSVGKPQCSDGIDNNGNKLIDKDDPNCHAGGNINATYDPTHNSESSPAPTQEVFAATTENSCALIAKNPLVFTADEQARLNVLLRQFYLVSSTLRTAEDLTTLNNEIDQNKNFISQIEGLTNQCYAQVTPTMIVANSWVRHGNPWFTKTSGGIFPYTDQKTGYGYLDYSQLEGGMTPAGFKVISGYYYGTLTSDVVVTTGTTSYFGMFESSSHQVLGSVGEDCSKFNNFAGYGLSNQINNKPAVYLGQYDVSDGKRESNGGGFPGDSLVSYDTRLIPNDPNQIDRALPQKTILEAGCSWKDGVILDNTERILNIW